MGAYAGPNISEDGLVLALDAANPKLRIGALFYRWFITNGTNPTTKEGFDAFFAVTPQASGIDYNREINWLVVADRPSYITQTTSFAWEVSGLLIVTEPGNYTFNTRSDDGNELQINGQVVASFYGGRGVGTGEFSTSINLGIGYHTFQYRMQQGGGGAGAQVRWQRPSSSAYEVIPASNFAVGISNNVFPDLIGNNNDGVLINGVGFDSANGGSLVFDGVNDYVSFTDKSEFTFTNAKFSLEIFFRYVNKTDTDNSIIGKRDYGFTQREYNFYVYEPSSTPTLRFIISSNLTANWTTVESSTIQKNTWYHAVATSDAGVGRIYLNGVLNATNNSMNSSTTNGTSPLTIGNAFSSGSALQYFNGSIPLARIYNRALTAQEIQQNYIATKSRFGL